ncbi:Fanconi anemia group I protein homolog [Nymphalis io]|uniref:Fanconi anemia group I protein homolog n=1 Tax=Inachis io TaxID=171585 RepID=UPI0021688F2C|nr:Fanconi anemia group I protein homolog [Nymphalis io]
MDAKTIFSKIIKFGQNNSEREELYKFCKLKLEQVFDEIPRRIQHNDGANLLDCIFNGLPDNTCKIKIKVIDIVLQTMRKESTSLTHCGDVISRLCLELPRLPLEHLVRWSSDSVQSIVDDSDVNMIWRDILPECLNAISLHDNVKHCGSELSGVEFKVQCVHTLCQCRWTEKQLVQLTAMFKDIQLLHADHRQVVNKICSYMVDISPDALPPLVHQLLKLCKLYNVEVVLAHLSHYFNVRLYSKLEPPPQDSESTTMDVDDIVQHSPAEMSRCLSTCLYHISQGAAEPELIRKHIKQWPKTQLLRTPFLIDLSLAVSDKGADFRSVCLDVIKSAIEFRILDELRSKESAWVRSVLPPDVDIVSVLKVLTTESANHRQLTVVGLINLAFSLLSVSRLKPTAQACWSHGKLILVRLCKAQPETAGHILSQLADKIFGDYSQHQYTDCLHLLCKLTPAAVERSAQLAGALESCGAGGAGGERVYGAVRPLLAYSARVRDALVMVCRKGLYSRDSSYRCLALFGFLTVLRHMKLSRELSSSQSGTSDQFSSHSYLTQLTVDMHATSQGAAITSRVRNETICLEVLSILRRCLVQDAAVKQLLYTDMYECTKDKPALHESILELFYEHLIKYLPDEDDETSILLFDKCVQLSSMSATLTEPIGRLLYVIAQFLQVEVDESEDVLGSQSQNGSTFLRNKLTDIMEKLCNSDLSAAIQMEDTSLNDLTPESKAKNIKVQQTLQCYEALIAHRIMQWNPENSNANSVHHLYKAYNQLLENTKGSPKTGKKTKSLNETKETVKSQKTQKSQKSQKEKGKSPKKVSNMVKDRAGPFKPLPCLWDLQLCLRVLDLLYAFQDMCDFDDHATLACLELYKTCLSLLLSPAFSLKLDVVMSGIIDNDKPATACIAEILEKVHSAVTHIETEAAEDDLDMVRKKILTTLIQIAILLLEIPVVPCSQLIGATLRLEELVRGSKQAECLGALGALLGAQGEGALLGDVLRKLSAELGLIDEEDSSADQETSSFPTIDSRSGHMVLGQVCAHLSNRFKSTEHLLSRARDLTAALSIAVHSHQQRIDREVQELYKSIVIQLCQLTTWTSETAKLRCCIGGGSDKVLNICMRLYSLLATFIKQLDPAMVQTLRLERLLKFSGKKLSAVTDGLITYLESSQQQQKASKVLRDTKLIPRLVLEAEQFSKHVILLGTKANLNFQQYLSLGTARDFKIKAPLLQGVINTGDQTNEKEVDEHINDAATEILSPLASDEERSNSGDECNNSDEEPSKNKRKRVS